MPKILLVEDNEMNRDMLSRRLARKGYEVLIAVDGAEGVAMAAAEKPDLDPDGHEPAGPGRLGGDPAAQGRAGDASHPGHRADGARHGERPGEGLAGRLRRLRHQADRAAAAAREDRAPARAGAGHERAGQSCRRSRERSRSARDAERRQRARLAHIRQELLAPVRAIVGYAEILRDEARRLGLERRCVPDLDRILTAAEACSSSSSGSWTATRGRDQQTGEAGGDVQERLRHDLRTPLNAIMGYGEMLLEDAERPRRRCVAGTILGSCWPSRADLLASLDAIVDFSGRDAATGRRPRPTRPAP